MKTEKIKKEAGKISLTVRERDALRARLISYIEYHPLRMPEPTLRASFGEYTQYAWRAIASLSITTRRGIAAAAVFVFLAVPVAAEQALPGDTLYPVKVRFNESVRAQLTFSPYEKMQWEAKRVERRVAEARLLAESGALTEEKEEALQNTVIEHTAAFQKQLATLRETDAEEAAIAEVALESALDVQTAILDADVLAASSTDQGGNVSDFAQAVRTARDGVATTSAATPSYERLIARVEENTTRIFALEESLAEELSDEEEAQIEERSASVDADIVSAKDAYARGEHIEAVRLLRDVFARTEKLIAFMNSIDVRTHVSLERLIPKEDTDAMAIESQYVALVESRTSFGETLEVIPEPLRTEITQALALFDEALATLGEQIAEGNPEAAEGLLEAEKTFSNIKTAAMAGTEDEEVSEEGDEGQ